MPSYLGPSFAPQQPGKVRREGTAPSSLLQLRCRSQCRGSAQSPRNSGNKDVFRMLYKSHEVAPEFDVLRMGILVLCGYAVARQQVAKVDL